jgi:hypothetical protein
VPIWCHFSVNIGLATETKTVLLAMSAKIKFRHQGIVLEITQERENRFVIPDYSTGRRVRHVRATEAAARDKAKEICEATAAGKRDLLELSPYESEIRAAFDALPGGIRLGRAVDIVRVCCLIVDPDEILTACRFWKDHRPDRRQRRITVNDGVKEFTGHHRASGIRRQNVSNFLDLFARKFGDNVIADLRQVEIENWFAAQNWAAKTSNDCLQMCGQFWKYAVKSGWAVKNIVVEIPRRKITRQPVAIYTPDALQSQLFNLQQNAPELLAAAVVGAFGGLRISEVIRC